MYKNYQEFSPYYIPVFYHTLPSLAIGYGELLAIIDKTDGEIIDGFSTGSLKRAVPNREVISIGPTFFGVDFESLRNYDMKATRKLKKRIKNKCLVLDWPDKSGSDIEMIKRFKPSYIICCSDFGVSSGSEDLLQFLNNPKGYHYSLGTCRKVYDFKEAHEYELSMYLLKRNDIHKYEGVKELNPLVAF